MFPRSTNADRLTRLERNALLDAPEKSVGTKPKTQDYPSVVLRERIADGIVHAFSLVGLSIACIVLLITQSVHLEPGMIWASVVYCGAILVSFATSAGYHLLPWHHWRHILRRLDHTAIYALIAGTFTPLLVHIGTSWSLTVLVMIWALAIPAMMYKLFGKNIEPRWSLASYLGLGWLGMLAISDLYSHIPTAAVTAIVVGGATYTVGTVFYVRKLLPYRNAIWHTFVLAGTGFLFFAVWTTVFADLSMAQ